MSFFLLGKNPDERLTLLSEIAFSSRHEALSELSNLTASPEFDAWESEVLVIDSDLGTPVLLVRPTPADTPDTTEPSEEAADLPADEPSSELLEDATLPELAEPVEEPASESTDEPDEALAAVLLDLGVEGEPETDQTAAAGEDAESGADPDTVQHVAESDEDVFVGESVEPATVVDAAWAGAVVSTEEAADDTLKGALKRTAEQMESQGISAPASVGPIVSESEELAAADEGEDADQPGSEPVGAAVEESADQAIAQAPEPPEGAEDTATGWPWDNLAESAASPAALEEPASDDESMIRALAEDESSRTVVLGEYLTDDEKAPKPPAEADAASEPDTEPEHETAVETPAETMPEAEVAIEVEVAGESEAASEGEAEAEAATAPESERQPEAATEVEADREVEAEVEPEPVEAESDFVDLGEVAAVERAKAYEPGDVDISGMSCDDCVYVDTCPNQGEREPTTCGSFQWK